MMIYEHGKEPREVKITPAAEGEQGDFHLFIVHHCISYTSFSCINFVLVPGERGKIAYYIDGIPAYEMPMPAGFRERAMEEVVSKIGQATFDQFVARQQEIVDKAATRTAAENAAATRKLMADMAALRDKLRA
jgi:hypothetical protein